MRISVLLSLYEKENPIYFDRSMQSVWDDQIRKPDQIVLVEDGFITNDLESLVEKWQAIVPVLKVIKLQENKGLPVALNEGIKYCDGDYIARMDTDDISLPERFLWQEDYLKKHPNIVVLGGGIIEFSDEDGEMQPRLFPLTTEEIKATIYKTGSIIHPTVIIKKELFEKGMQYNPESRKFQDLELWYKLLAAGYEMANLNKVILKFRKDPFMYKKRNKAANKELKIMFKGIYSLYGPFTMRYIYPMVHYMYRQLPPTICMFIYKKIILNYWNKKSC